MLDKISKYIIIKIIKIFNVFRELLTVVEDIDNTSQVLLTFFKYFKRSLVFFFIIFLIQPYLSEAQLRLKLFDIITFYLFLYFSIFSIYFKLKSFNFDFQRFNMHRIVDWLSYLCKYHPIIAFSLLLDFCSVFLTGPTPGWCIRNLILDNLDVLNYRVLFYVWEMFTIFFMVFFLHVAIHIYFLALFCGPKWDVYSQEYLIMHNLDKARLKLILIYVLICFQFFFYTNVLGCFTILEFLVFKIF